MGSLSNNHKPLASHAGGGGFYFFYTIMMLKRFLPFLLAIVCLAACGPDSKHFKLEGRLLNINQGDFFVYNDDGLVNGIDTIHVEGGRFAYEMECPHPTTLYLVFPNFSVQPIFAQPGKSVSIKGDASHLKEMEVKGTDDNEQMTQFRQQAAKASPPEVKHLAEQFMQAHPQSPVSVWLLRKYFIATPQPDMAKAAEWVQKLHKSQVGNRELVRLAAVMPAYGRTAVGAPLPRFTARDTHGRTVSAQTLSAGVAVVCTWASWNYDSMDMLRMIKQVKSKAGGRLKVLSLCIDANRADGDNAMRADSLTWSNVCDGQMFKGAVVQQLGMFGVPDNIVLRDGRIVARNLDSNALRQRLENMLGIK